VHDERSIAAAKSSTQSSKAVISPANASAQYDQDPESTYDVFQRVSFAGNPIAKRISQPLEISDVALTAELMELLQIYQKGIGTWMDVFSQQLTYQHEVVRLALASPLLLHSICSLAAKQMSLISDPSIWEGRSSHQYGKSLALLITELADQQSSREVILAATIFLCSYELLGVTSIDYQRHLYGVRTLVRAHDILSNGSSVEHASFWIYARQDVAFAVANERPTVMPSQEWPPSSPTENPDDGSHARHVLWLLARLLEIRFGDSNSTTPLWEVAAELDNWWERLPEVCRGIKTGSKSTVHEKLSNVFFHISSAGTKAAFYSAYFLTRGYSCWLLVLSHGHDPLPGDIRG
jgi:hypothetical protein